MDVRVQVVLVFSIIFVAAIVLAIFRKKERKLWIYSAAGLVPVAICVCIAFGVMFIEKTPDTILSKKVYTQKDSGACLDTVSYIMADNDIDSAQRFLDDYTDRYPITDGYRLAYARLSALRGDYRQASGIYEQLESTSYAEQARTENQLVADVVDGRGSFEQLSRGIIENIRKNVASENAERAANIYSEINSFNENGMTQEKAEELAEELETISRDEPALMYSEPMRMAQVKAMMIAGKYKEIAELEYSFDTANEYLVLAELLRRGRFTDDMIKSSSYLNNRMKENIAVRDWITAQRTSYSYSEEESAVLDEAIEQLGELENNRLTYQLRIKNTMRYLASREAERESSKLYLQLARMEFDEGNRERATMYLRRALQTAGDSRDKAYSGPVAELNEILTDKEQTEGFKDIDKYTELMVANMVPEDMKLRTAAGTGSSGYSGDDFARNIYDVITDDSFDINTPVTDEAQEDFSQYVSTNVNQMNAAVTISQIDASGFDTVTAVVAVDEQLATTENEFREQFYIEDCDVEIKNYDVEKLEDTDVNIVLCCDNSGSMSGNKIEDLKKALMSFADELDADVEVGIVAFDSGVLSQGSCSLGSSESQIRSAIQSMSARGGTNIRTGVDASLRELYRGDDLNIIIVMSDGQDGMPSSDALIELRNACTDLGATIYTMGLGSDVDSTVLSSYSDYGGGSYTFVSDSDALLSFYKYIYAASKNRFRITFTAEDTLHMNRHLEVSSKTDAKITDRKRYSLYETSDLSEDDLGEEYSVVLEGVTIGGLDTRLLYKSSYDQEISLLGDGLTEEHEIKVTIKSGMTYELPCKYVSPTEWKVTVPAKVACGEYDVYVSIDGKKAIFDSGLVVTDDNMNIVRFGPYVFEGSGYEKLGNTVKLTGYVTMNGWLGFANGVTLTGDTQNGTQIKMDTDRVYVAYKKGDTSLNLFAKAMADHGRVISIKIPEPVELYRNEGIPSGSGEFRVSRNVLYAGININGLFTLSTPGLSVYPDKLKVGFEDFTTEFPFQDKLLKTAGLDKLFEYKAGHEETLIVSGSAVDCALKLKIGTTDSDEFHETYFGNMKLLLNLNDFELNIDTDKNDYSVKFIVNVGMLCDGLGLELAWKGGGFDTARLYADKKITKVISGVPITFSDFKLGATDIKDGINKVTLEGGCDIATAKLSDVYKGLEKFIDDAPVLKLDNVTLQLRLARPYISLSTKAKLLGVIDLGEASVQLGMGISYSNPLIDQSGTSINGFVGKVTANLLKMQLAKTDITVAASGELAVSDKVIGASAKGEVSVNLEWWIIHKDFKEDGALFVGMYRQHNGLCAFGMIAQSNGGKRIEAIWTEKGAIK